MTGLGRPRLAGLIGCWLVFCTIAMTPLALAQFPGFNLPQNSSDEQSLYARLPKETQTTSTVHQARELLKSSDYSDAIELLQPLLETSEDIFEIDQSLAPTGSTFQQIELMLRGMPAEGLEVYRRQFESFAEQLLREARQSRSLSQYFEIIRRYPATVTWQTAVAEGAALAQDLGESSVAARLRERLLEGLEAGENRNRLLIEIARDWTLAGQPERAQAAVQELSQLAKSAPLQFEGQLLTPPATADAVWLNKVFGPVKTLVPARTHDWTNTGGHPRRWSDGALVSIVDRGTWSYPLIDRFDTRLYEDLPPDSSSGSGPSSVTPNQTTQKRHEKMLALLKVLEQKYLVQKNLGPQVPVLVGAPLIVNGTALVQGLGTVKAIDLQTGNLRWSGVVEDNAFLYWVFRCLQDDGAQTGFIDLFLGQRTWLNQTAASLSSDGERVYSITGTGVVGLMRRNPFAPGRAAMPRSELSPSNENRLLAYDIQTGRLRWELGGAPLAEFDSPVDAEVARDTRLGGAYFLGAPLAVDGRLYVMAEDHGQIRLFSLRPETGAVDWSIALANPDDSIDADDSRRIAGLSPTYAGGLLFCPTGEGVVVAVDPYSRRLKWIHQYRSKVPSLNPRAMAFRMRGDRFGAMDNRELERQLRQRRWFDASVVATEGRLIVPTPDDHQLLCLDQETGKRLWSLPRNDGLFVATSTGKNCLVAGERTIQAIRLTDGSTVWSQEIPTPTGRGVLVAMKYLLPVSSGEILAIDTSSRGKILARKTIASSPTPGTLVAAGDQLLMQTASELVGFRSLSEIGSEVADRLAQAGSRPQALTEQALLLLLQGQEADAISQLRQSIQLEDSETTRQLLGWVLLERLKTDYVANRNLIPELQLLVRDPGQRKLLFRLNAEGMERTGEYVHAFEEYLKLALEVGQQEESRVEVSRDLQVREDRWLRGRITHLFQLVDDSQRQQMLSMIRDLRPGLTAITKRQMANVLGMDLAPQLFLELVREEALTDILPKRVLWALSESQDLKLRGPAVARLVREDLSGSSAGRILVSHLLPQLEKELADVECEPGLTGKAFLESIRADAKLGKALADIQKLGLPAIEPATEVSTNSVVSNRELIPVLGARHGVYREWQFSVERHSNGTVYCSDASGRDRHQFFPQPNGINNDQPVRYVQTDSHLVLIVFRDQFVVVNPLEPVSQPRQVGALTTYTGYNDRLGNVTDSKAAIRDKLYTSRFNRQNSYIGNVGPLLFDTLVYQIQDGTEEGDLVAVVPYERRKELWRRKGLPIGCEILGDETYTVLITPLTRKLLVLRTADGVQIAERTLPAKIVDRRRAEWGRMFLVQPDSPMGQGETFAMYDPVTDRNVWSHSFPTGTHWAPVNGEELAFWQPDGQLTLIDDLTGQEIWSSKVSVPSVPRRFQIHSDQERLYLQAWDEPTAEQDAVRSDPNGRFTGVNSGIPVNGAVVALERSTGHVIWTRTVSQQVLRESMPVGTGLIAYSAARQRKTAPNRLQDYTQVELIDRATGKTVFDKEFPPSTTDSSWKLLHNGVLRVRLSGADLNLSWKQDNAGPQQTEPIPPGEPVPEEGPIKLQ